MRRSGRVLRPMAKAVGMVIGGLLALALLAFAVVFVVNIPDEALSPAAQSLLVAPPNPYAPEDNAYLVLAGLDAPPGVAPVEAGQVRVEHYNRELAFVERNPTPQNIDDLKLTDPHRLEFAGEFEFAQPLDSYWDDIPRHQADVEARLADNLELYQRYLALQRTRGYYETELPSMLAPVYFVPSNLRTLFLAEVVLRLRGRDPRQQAEALADLEADMRVWKSVLTGQGAIISKLLAIAYLHWDELLLADMIADPKAPVPLGDGDAEQVAPLFALDDWDISRAYPFDFRVQAAFLRQSRQQFHAGWMPPGTPGGLPGLLARTNMKIGAHFFQTNATINLFAAQVARLTRQAAPAPHDEPAADEVHLASFRSVYNPIGKYLAAVAGAHEPYPARAWDGAAFQRLLRLSYEIRRQRVAAAAIPTFLARHPEWAHHPADGR
ncbi:MAG TPA: hypothetical protein VET66_11920, partial [Steroidobacteraceae bacterium]|nr:hypothetical protein [Steroidobacteraceae bacterium]